LIKAYSQRLMPPYSGQMQVVETDRARALTLDSSTWEIQFLHSTDNHSHGLKRSYMRVATISNSDIKQKKFFPSSEENDVEQTESKTDERMLELLEFLYAATLPFPAADKFEFWLLDSKEKKPLALIYTCINEEQMSSFPEQAEWSALPDAVMPIERSEEEKEQEYAPINYQLERLVAARAGFNAKAQWFNRETMSSEMFPDLMLREDWEEPHSADLCQRYLKRQSPRLLMLHNLSLDVRRQCEVNAREHALEVERFHLLYPEIVDQALIDAVRVEAKLRAVTEGQPAIHKRRDGIHYI